jgi:hypothetical protein
MVCRNLYPHRAGDRSSHLFRRTLAEIRAAIPPRYFVQDTIKGLLYLSRDVLMAATCWKLATHIDPFFKNPYVQSFVSPAIAEIARWSAWAI